MWKYQSKKRDKYYNKVIRLYTDKGFGCTRISRIIPVGRTTISAWISTFVSENPNSMRMKKSNRPVSSNVPDIDCKESKALQAEIAQLKKRLAHESLRADAYEELINVAEKQFNISIRKKAGTKQ